MATLALDRRGGKAVSDHRFAATMAMVMAVVVVTGFSNQFLMGRSTFAAPLRVHIHAVIFMGWIGIFVMQTRLAARGPFALHRKLGWVAVGWLGLMLVAAMAVLVGLVRDGRVPFFYQPEPFLIANPLTVFSFVGFVVAAVVMRKRTDWHARLSLCGMTMIMGPAFGRLLPMPFLIPYAMEASGLAGSVFLIAGMIRDKRKIGAVHPAWWIGLGMLFVPLITAHALADTAFGNWLYQSIVAGSPGAAVPGMKFAPLPAALVHPGR